MFLSRHTSITFQKIFYFELFKPRKTFRDIKKSKWHEWCSKTGQIQTNVHHFFYSLEHLFFSKMFHQTLKLWLTFLCQIYQLQVYNSYISCQKNILSYAINDLCDLWHRPDIRSLVHTYLHLPNFQIVKHS